MKPELREDLGKTVRQAWIQWAMTQDNPKEPWLVPWESMKEEDKEADRQIAEAVVIRLGEMLVSPILGVIFSEEQIEGLLLKLVEDQENETNSKLMDRLQELERAEIARLKAPLQRYRKRT